VHGLLSTLWAALILLLGPIAGIAGGRKLRTTQPRRKIVYFSNAANLILLGIITAVIDRSSGHKAVSLITLSSSPRVILLWSVWLSLLCIAVASAVLVARAWLHRTPKPSVIRLLPRSRGEKIGFLFLCLLIGIVEEFIYRGFVLTILRHWLASDAMAVLLVSISFALMHGVQDFIAIASAFILSVLLSIPVIILHSLIPSMAAHFAVDLFVGLCMLTLLRRLGAPAESDELEQAAVNT
jgi:membrane protease YdiL (CAAX protease family)